MSEGEKKPKVYLGDGAYAEANVGYDVRVYASNGISEGGSTYLGRRELIALARFASLHGVIAATDLRKIADYRDAERAESERSKNEEPSGDPK